MSSIYKNSILTVSTSQRQIWTDITAEIKEEMKKSGVVNGFCHIMVLHTTAAIIINENDDPNIGKDLFSALNQAIPQHANWLHDQIDNNAQAHILASILGPSEMIPIQSGELVLGRWQGIILVEFDGPKSNRKVSISFVGESFPDK